MAANHAKVLLGIAVVIVGGVVAYQVALAPPASQAPPPPGPPPGPPPNAQFLDLGPADLLGSVLSARPGRREQMADQFYGKWVPPEGWPGEATLIETDDGTQVISMFFGSMSAISEYWIVARMAAPVQVEKGQRIRVQGRLSSVDRKILMANVRTEIVLDQARLVP